MALTLIPSTASRLAPRKPDPGKLAYTTKEVCQVLGISPRSIKRLEQRGLIRSSNALRTKLYPRMEVERFLQDTLS